ncbi:hypothetical protein [Agromyces italicus]|uniref:hypothetical protein n=1 Tax=Agromyces italicus TaxID=279572 RepID=UPI0012F7C5C3|nr:hypothetical protein [Agromyces italicus]
MTERPVKVDAATNALIDEFAYFLGTTKKAVLREAMLEFAASRRRPGRGDERRRFAELPLDERLVLRRGELLRAFEQHGATNVRLLDEEYREHPGALALLVETDVAMGSAAAPLLSDLARRLLDAPVEVISATALSLFNPNGLRRAIAESRPL